VEAKKPSTEEAKMASLQSAVESLTLEIKQMRTQQANR
jgi:hypothetical protein